MDGNPVLFWMKLPTFVSKCLCQCGDDFMERLENFPVLVCEKLDLKLGLLKHLRESNLHVLWRVHSSFSKVVTNVANFIQKINSVRLSPWSTKSMIPGAVEKRPLVEWWIGQLCSAVYFVHALCPLLWSKLLLLPGQRPGACAEYLGQFESDWKFTCRCK